MKSKQRLLMTTLLLAAVLFSACQLRRPGAAANLPQAPAAGAAAPTAVEPAPTQPPVKTLAPTAAPLPTQDPEKARAGEAEQAARAYFAAVSEGKSDEAAGLLSRFSLMVFQMTQGDAASELQTQKIEGTRWSDLEVLGAQSFGEQTILVHVTYSAENKGKPAATPTPEASAAEAKASAVETKDELWPMRFENGAWRYNWKNLIDFRTLDTRPQTMNGITIMPVQINRFSDRVQLSMLVQNRTNESMVFGQVNETLGIFHFGDQAVVAEKTQWILNPLRSVPAATLEAKGLYEQYPDTIEIRKWNITSVKPWYDFQLQ